MSSSRSAPYGRILPALVMALVLAGCGVRVGHPPTPVPQPDAAEEQRQSVAVALERVLLAAADSPEDDAQRLVVVLEAYLEDVGGVWLPPPRDEDPEPTSPAASDLPGSIPAAAELSAGELAQAFALAPPEQREALASMWLTVRTAQAAFDGEPGPSCTLPCGEGMIPPSPLPEASPELVGIYDALGYLEEIRAARGDSDTRDGIAAGARALRSFAQELAGDANGTEADIRQGAYPLDPDDLGGSAGTFLAGALTEWLTAVAESGDPDSLGALWHTSVLINPGHEISPWPGL